MNSDVASVVFGYLSPTEAVNLSLTCKFFATEAKKNQCVVVEEHICWGEATSGMTWTGQQKSEGQTPCFQAHYASTKANAVALAGELLKKKLVFSVRVGFQQDFAGGFTFRLVGFRMFDYNTCRRSDKWFYKRNV